MFQIMGASQDSEHVSVILKIWQVKGSGVSKSPVEERRIEKGLGVVLRKVSTTPQNRLQLMLLGLIRSSLERKKMACSHTCVYTIGYNPKTV